MALLVKRYLNLSVLSRSTIFFTVSICIVNLQMTLTNTFRGIDSFVAGEMGPIFTSRVLTRYILILFSTLFPHYSLTEINFWFQTASMFFALSVVYAVGTILTSKLHGFTAAMICSAMIPWGFLRCGFNVSYPYDLPALLATALGLYAILRRIDLLFYTILFLAALNKETVIWLIPIFVLYQKTDNFFDKNLIKKLLYALLAYSSGYVGVRYMLYGSSLFFEMNRFVSTHQNDDPRLFLNLAQFASPFRGDYTQWLYYPLIMNLLPLVFFQNLPKLIRYSYTALPFYLVPIFIAGNVNEFRLFNEILPVSALALPYLFVRPNNAHVQSKAG